MDGWMRFPVELVEGAELPVKTGVLTVEGSVVTEPFYGGTV